MIKLTVTSSKPTMGMTSLVVAMFIGVALASGGVMRLQIPKFVETEDLLPSEVLRQLEEWFETIELTVTSSEI